MFDTNRFDIGEKAIMENIIAFQEKEGVLISPSHLYM